MRKPLWLDRAAHQLSASGGAPAAAQGEGPLLSVVGLVKHFPIHKGAWRHAAGFVRAVDGIDFEVGRREVVGLVGESGSGKTTVGRVLMRILAPTAGRILFDGIEVSGLDERGFKPFRRRMQIIFQDPFSSLDPRMRVEELIGEGLAIHGIGTARQRRERVAFLLERVGLSADHMRRYPHEFSGGQRQRVGIARALAVEAEFIVADEPVSALDVSVQAQVINLLEELQREIGLSLLFISHDLSLVEYISDRVIVMYLGRIMEVGPASSLYAAPKHPYTEALLSATPNPDPDAKRGRIILKGDVPSPADPPSGCVFRTRCRYAVADCANLVPPLRQVGEGHASACIRDDIF